MDPWLLPEPHGTTALRLHYRLMAKHSYNRQRYGRNAILDLNNDCDHCALTDRAAARRRHIRTLYRRRNR